MIKIYVLSIHIPEKIFRYGLVLQLLQRFDRVTLASEASAITKLDRYFHGNQQICCWWQFASRES